jgi:hypothetical protein
VAVIALAPDVNAVVVKVAWPVLETVPVPRTVPLSAKLTVPVGVPLLELGVTVAVKVTGWVATDVESDAVTEVVVPLLDWLAYSGDPTIPASRSW